MGAGGDEREDSRWVDLGKGKVPTQTATDCSSFLKDYFLQALIQDPCDPLKGIMVLAAAGWNTPLCHL